MNFIKAKTMILGIEFCCLCLCLSVPIPAADIVETIQKPIFEPGKEYHIVTDNEAIGTKSFNLYVPLDYTEDRDWPASIRFNIYQSRQCDGFSGNACILRFLSSGNKPWSEL